jgi:hypothetical protein
MIRLAQLLCLNNHLWLAFSYDDTLVNEAWAHYQLGLLTGAFSPGPPFGMGCPVCGEIKRMSEISNFDPPRPRLRDLPIR